MPAVLHQVAGPVVDGHRPLLRADLRHALELAGGADHRPAFGHGQGDRLFDVGVHAGLHGEDRDPGAGVRGGFDHHGVELLVLDHLAEVGIGAPRLAAGKLLDVLLGLLDLAIAGRHDLESLDVGRFANQPRTAAAADHAHTNGFAGRAAPVQAQGTSRDEGRNGRGCGPGTEKVSTGPT